MRISDWSSDVCSSDLNGKLPESFFLQDEAWYSENRIDLHLGLRAERLDLAGGAVTLQNGDSVRADRVLLATGGAARRLPLAGADAPNVHHLRTKDDADHLAKDLVAGARIVVIGMGVIGAEVAASARKAGRSAERRVGTEGGRTWRH